MRPSLLTLGTGYGRPFSLKNRANGTPPIFCGGKRRVYRSLTDKTRGDRIPKSTLLVRLILESKQRRKHVQVAPLPAAIQMITFTSGLDLQSSPNSANHCVNAMCLRRASSPPVAALLCVGGLRESGF